MDNLVKETLAKLEALGQEKVRAQNKKKGAGDKQFGVRMGDIRKLAKKLKTNHELAFELWETENIDARLLAILLLQPKDLSAKEVDKLVRSEKYHWIADWLNSYIVKNHPDNETLRKEWMQTDDPMAARAGWNLTSIRIEKSPEGLDIPALLNRLEAEMGDADSSIQWTMNFALVQIGINFPAYRNRALAIGEKLGVYSDYPTSKGCTSPFAPIWINEMVKRQG